ncbi:hypothetical protein R1sor_013744 [Riccia sorocarpa]|uniref:Uncharacterized protein n=1 Tax=Riccia sorocarpa TaxID=122646 RepID=A0ABD3H7G6_9MARC
MDASTCIGCGRSGDVYLVGVVDPELADQIGHFDVVFYVAKRLKDQWYKGSGFDELVKEFTAFPLNSPIICSPTAGFFDRLNPTLVFPWWNGGQISDWIEREFELRWKRSPNGQRREPVADDIIAKMRLREALEQMTAADIANRHDYRMTARYWVTYFQNQLMIDPLVCQRPLESKPRAKKHPDGPREIGKDKL